MKRHIFLILIACITIVSSACTSLSKKQQYTEALVDLHFYSTPMRTLAMNNVKSVYKEQLWQALRPTIISHINSNFTEEEIQDILLIYNSPLLHRILKNLQTDNISEEDVETIKKLQKLSPGFRKFCSREFRQSLQEALTKKRNPNDK